jgi:hypothetical protein
MAKATDEQIQAVFDAWKAHRERPELTRLTKDRQKLISDRLGLGYTPEDFVALVNFVHLSSDQWCVYMRNNQYTGLDYLLRKEKLADRVERALNWQIETADAERKRVEEEASGLSLGILGQFRRGAR